MSGTVVISDDFDEEDLCVGGILRFVNDNLQTPTIYDHPHVIAAMDDDLIYLLCGTSKQATVERKIKNHDLDYSYFPLVKPCKDNTLTEITFIDCYSTYEIYKWKLQEKFQKGEVVKHSGKITYHEYEQIRKALKGSKTVDFKDLLIHPDDK